MNILNRNIVWQIEKEKRDMSKNEQVPEYTLQINLTKEQYGLVLFLSQKKEPDEFIIDMIMKQVEETKKEIGI